MATSTGMPFPPCAAPRRAAQYVYPYLFVKWYNTSADTVRAEDVTFSCKGASDFRAPSCPKQADRVVSVSSSDEMLSALKVRAYWRRSVPRGVRFPVPHRCRGAGGPAASGSRAGAWWRSV